MRVLLDECVNERLREHLKGHDCQSARFAGLGGLTNGKLLTAAEAARFEVLITVDRGFEYQQNLSGRRIAVIILCSVSIALDDLVPLVPVCLARLGSIQQGQVVKIGPADKE